MTPSLLFRAARPLGALASAFALTLSPLLAATYYVSPDGDDSLDGLTPATAWRTIGKVNARTFLPGDEILLQGGATFTDAGLSFGSDDGGDAAKPVRVGSHGTGRAHIRSADTDHPLQLHNTAGFLIENLVLEGAGQATSTRTGLHVYTDLPGDTRLRGLTVRDCEITGVRTGLGLGAWATDGSFSGFEAVLIERLLVHTCRRDGIVTYGYSPGSATRQSHRDVVIRDCEVRHVTGDPTKTDSHSGSGIIVSGVKGGLIDRCYAHHNGGSAGNSSGGGPVGIWTWGSDSVTIQRSLVHDQKTTAGVKDGGGFDVDGGATNAVIQYCYSYNNEGPGFLIAEYDNAPPIANVVMRHNISWRDGRRTGNNMASGFHFWKGAGAESTVSNIDIYHNLVYTENATGGPAVRWQSGAMSGVRLRNNVFVVSGGERFVEVNRDDARGYFTFQGNAYWAVDGDWSGGWRWGLNTSFASLADWRAATGTPETLGGQALGLDVDPRIALLVAGAQPTSVAAMEQMPAFRLLADSPLLDAGLDLRTATHGSLDVGTRDFFGQPVPSGKGFDIGPHERTAVLGLPEPVGADKREP